MAIELGDEVRDTITGFAGVVIGLTQWLHGCRRITVQPRELKDGKPIEAMSFDEPQLEVVKAANTPEPVKQERARTGGPRPEPQRRTDPT
jgi:hypothetical protein